MFSINNEDRPPIQFLAIMLLFMVFLMGFASGYIAGIVHERNAHRFSTRFYVTRGLNEN